MTIRNILSEAAAALNFNRQRSLLTMASLVLAGVHVCNSFIMDGWMRHEWNRLDALRQRIRKARMHQLLMQNQLTKGKEALANLQVTASQMERRVQATSRRGMVV